MSQIDVKGLESPAQPPSFGGMLWIPGDKDHGFLVRSVAVGLLLGALSVGLTAAMAAILDVSHDFLTREPQATLESKSYVGFMSNLGMVIWSIPAVACGLTATVVIGRQRWMFAFAGVLTTLLLADDLFMLHDGTYPKIGFAEELVEVLYLVAVAAIVVLYREELGRTAILGIGLTVAFWGTSGFLDLFFNDDPINLDQLTEDGAKLMGIFVWAAVWTATCHLALRRHGEPDIGSADRAERSAEPEPGQFSLVR